MWLLPVVFMLHDFEEIIFFAGLAARKRGRLEKEIACPVGGDH